MIKDIIITLLDKEYRLSDNAIASLSLTLGANERSSSFSASLIDNDFAISRALFEYSKASGGIQLPYKPEPPASDPSLPANPGSGSGLLEGLESYGLNLSAFIKAIGLGEGTLGTNNELIYNIRFGGSTFVGYSDHPRILFCTSFGLCSDASGAMQWLSTTWDTISPRANVSDFSPRSQNLATIPLIEDTALINNAIALINSGSDSDIVAAAHGCNNIWASLPGSFYGQPTVSDSEFLNKYKQIRNKDAAINLNTRTALDKTRNSVDEETSLDVFNNEEKQGIDIYVTLQTETTEYKYSYFWYGMTKALRSGSVISLSGQSEQAKLDLVERVTGYENLTALEYAEIIARKNKINVVLPLSVKPTIARISSDKETDLQTLMRVSQASGLNFYSNPASKELVIVDLDYPIYQRTAIPDVLDVSFSDQGVTIENPTYPVTITAVLSDATLKLKPTDKVTLTDLYESIPDSMRSGSWIISDIRHDIISRISQINLVKYIKEDNNSNADSPNNPENVNPDSPSASDSAKNSGVYLTKVSALEAKLNDSFGIFTVSQGWNSRHQGLDVYRKDGKTEGTPIYAIGSKGDAVEIKVYYEPIAGLTIYQNNNNMSVSFSYAHCLNTILGQKGSATVYAGDKIGEMGNTGTMTTGSHLHMEQIQGNSFLGKRVPVYTSYAKIACGVR